MSNTLSKFGFGSPTEYFRYPYGANEFFAESDGRVLDRFSSLVLRHAQGGIFGSKMSHDHRAHLDAHLRCSLDGYRSISDVLPGHRWIFIRRKDTIAQAISWHIAESLDRWHVPSGSGATGHHDIPYDFFAILSKLMIIGANNANWEAYFSATGIQPHRLHFEDLVSDPGSEISEVMKFMGIDCDRRDVVLERDGGLRSIAQSARSTYEPLKNRFADDFLRIGESDDRARLGPALDEWNRFFLQSGWHRSTISSAANEGKGFGADGGVIWFTGLPGAGKSTLARALEVELNKQGLRACVLDGDDMRQGLNKDLGFTDADRAENIRRVAEVAKLMAEAGLIVITAFISPFRQEREMARRMIGRKNFAEVHVSTPLAVCEQRDPKGLYRRARAGQLPHMTGIDSPYEAPEHPDIVVDGTDDRVDGKIRTLLSQLESIRASAAKELVGPPGFEPGTKGL